MGRSHYHAWEKEKKDRKTLPRARSEVREGGGCEFILDEPTFHRGKIPQGSIQQVVYEKDRLCEKSTSRGYPLKGGIIFVRKRDWEPDQTYC